METFAGALTFVLPLFILLIAVEFIVAKVRKKEVINLVDTVSSLSSGITNALFKILGLTVYIFSYEFLLQHIAFFQISSKALEYFVCFLVLDSYVYWWHRWRHRYNILWNEHLIHHSSEEYNLPVALRQTIADFVNPAAFLLAPAALFSISMEVLTLIGVVMLFGGFWYHTTLIDKMGFLEKIIVTPSHHRIHHAINPIYIDKNFGGILIIWDKMFGTFQEELPDIKPVYGVTRPVQTWNPIKINFLHLSLLAKDAWRTASIRDKFRIWFMPTGWRPSDVAEKYPVPYIKNVSSMEKYNPPVSTYLKAWACIQLVATFLLMMFMITQMASFSKYDIMIYSAFIFLSVYSYTSLMDKTNSAWVFELVRLTFGIGIIRYYGDWFGLNDFVPQGNAVVATYFAAALLASIAFEYLEFRKDSRVRMAI